MLVIRPTTTIDEVVEMLRRLTVIAHQIIDDVEDAGNKGDLYLLYDRMVANAEDLEVALQMVEVSQQQVAQAIRQGEM
jgi:hypothetical protein